MNRRIALVAVVLVSSACNTNYMPSAGILTLRGGQPERPAPRLERDDAEVALIKALKEGGLHGRRYEEIATGDSSFRFVARQDDKTERWSCPYAGTPAPDVEHRHSFPYTAFWSAVGLQGCAVSSGTARKVSWEVSQAESANRFADALSSLAQGEPVDPAQEPEFQKVVQQYRAAAGRSPVSEEVRAHRVAAQDAVKEKRFEDAVNEYGEALKLAPSWPQGHFNRALILAELGAYSAATRGMKRYLLLEPDAENARQVQDKIYAWQAKVK